MSGINVDKLGRCTPQQVLDAGGDSVRICLSAEHDQTNILRGYAERKLYILGVYDGDSDNGFRSHDEAMAYYANAYGRFLSAVEVGNEPDLESPSSWTMTQRDLANLGWMARTRFGEQMYLVCGGLASGQSGWLESLDRRWCNYLGVHPYAKDESIHRFAGGRGPLVSLNDLPDIEPLMQGYAEYGLPLMITEWGWWGDEHRGKDEVRDVVRWAERSPLVERFFYFCYSDAMVAPFGLFRSDGAPKPAAISFQQESRWQEAPLPLAPSEPDSPVPNIGWIGDGLLRALTEQGWVPTTGEHDETFRLVRAGDDIIVWDQERGEAIPYQRV